MTLPNTSWPTSSYFSKHKNCLKSRFDQLLSHPNTLLVYILDIVSSVFFCLGVQKSSLRCYSYWQGINSFVFFMHPQDADDIYIYILEWWSLSNISSFWIAKGVVVLENNLPCLLIDSVETHKLIHALLKFLCQHLIYFLDIISSVFFCLGMQTSSQRCYSYWQESIPLNFAYIL